MDKYQKIDTLYIYDGKIKRFVDRYTNPLVGFLHDVRWLCGEKVDGINIRVHFDGYRVEWNGRTDDAQLPVEVQTLLQDTFGDSEVLFEQTFGNKDVYLFMECYGGKIQGGAYGGKERLIGFDVKVGGIYLDKHIIADIFSKFGIPCVQFFEVSNLDEAIGYVKRGIDHPNERISPLCEKGKTIIEGLVAMPAMRLYDHMGERIIVKIKVRDLRKTVAL